VKDEMVYLLISGAVTYPRKSLNSSAAFSRPGKFWKEDKP